MRTKLLNRKFANKVYDILIDLGGAKEADRDDFIYHHCQSEYGCMEWRFMGHFGLGGKYRSTWNGVTHYPEDETGERIKLKEKINEKLKNI